MPIFCHFRDCKSASGHESDSCKQHCSKYPNFTFALSNEPVNWVNSRSGCGAMTTDSTIKYCPYAAFTYRRGYLIMSLSRCGNWPTSSLHYSTINNIMHAVKTLLLLERFALDIHACGRCYVQKRWSCWYAAILHLISTSCVALLSTTDILQTVIL